MRLAGPERAAGWPGRTGWLRSPAHRRVLTLVPLTLASFLLRAAHLGAKDLRGDESFAAVFSAQPLGIIWQSLGQSEPHPPLYYVLLHALIALAGPSNLSLRFLSLCFGTLAVPALGVAAWRAFGPRAALLTALLAAVNPLLVWQAQDARMYAELVGFTGLALAGVAYALWSGRSSPTAWWAALGGGAGVLLTHFYGTFVVAALVAVLLLSAWHRARAMPAPPAPEPSGSGRLGPWRPPTVAVGAVAERDRLMRLAALLALEILLLALPLLYHGRQALTGHPPFAALSLGGLVASIGQTLAGGVTTPIPLREPASVAAVLLAVAGLALAWRLRRRAALLVTCSLLAPLAGLAALELLHPAYQPAYAAVLAPAWLLAVGALALPRPPRAWLGAGAALVLLGIVSEQSLTTYAASQKNLTFGQAGQFLLHAGQSGDLILTNYPDPTLDWIYRRQDGGALPVLLEPPAMPVDPAALDRRMIDLGERYDRIWFWTLRTAAWDSQHAAEIWLDRHAIALATERAGNVEFRLFETPRGFLTHTTPLPATTFGGQLRLRGASWDPEEARAGSMLDITVCWQAVTMPRGDYTAFVHLEQGTTLGGQDDHPPVNGLNPTHTWLSGESFLDRYHIAIPSSTAPGVYAMRIGFYAPATLQRLPLLDAHGATIGDALTVGQVTVR